MSGTKHTPGPWFFGIAYEPQAGEKPPSYSGPGYYNNPGILSSATGETIVGCDEYDVFGPSMEAREANIQMMTAAPDLLEALVDVLRIARAASIGVSGNTARIERATAAIAKATRGQR